MAPLLGVFPSVEGALYVVGRQGLLAVREPASSSFRVADIMTVDCLHAIAPYAGGYVAVGGNLLSPAMGLKGVLFRAGSPISPQLTPP